MSLLERVEVLPTGPGVYLFKSRSGRVLYVGKAQNLRTRVRSYVSGSDGRIRVPLLLERAADVEVVVTRNVSDALLLENELIKQHKPPFNVRLRDDKQYLALRLDPGETWPRLHYVRRFKRDGAHYFGPYTSSVAMKESLSNLRKIFPLRSCRDAVFRDYARRGRPCIEYEMKRCSGPCVGLIDEPGYAELVHGTTLFLRGQSDTLRRELEAAMQRAAAEERFEDAARLRNRVAAVERTSLKQQMVAEKPLDRDVFGLARQAGEVEVRVLHVREGRVVGARAYEFSDVRLDDGAVLSSFLGQYYAADAGRSVPPEVLTPIPAEDAQALSDAFSQQAGRKVALRTPQRGPAAQLVETASANAELGLSQRLDARESVQTALEELKQALRLADPPRRIECYDVSTLHGTLSVASRVVFEDGQPQKNDYRRYRIRRAAPDDDYACLREVMDRRLGRVASEPLPDLLMVDGGKGQLGVLQAALRDHQLEAACVGIAKERDEQSPTPRVRRSGGLKAERLFLPNVKDPVRLPASSRALLLLQRVRDESHRFAIEFQRLLRSKVHTTSILEELPGIGPGKRKALLKHLGSLRAVRATPEDELARVPGISARDASTLRRFFDAVAETKEESGDPEKVAPASETETGAGSGHSGPL